MSKDQGWCGSVLLQLKIVTVGTLVAVRFSEDGLIYRAKVGMAQGNLSNDAPAGFIG